MAILTVSRELGSGGREIGRMVAESLAYGYVDKEKILGDIKASGYKWEEWADDLDEHRPSVWERYDWSFRGLSALIQSAVLSEALKDRVVIMGRGGNFLLKDIAHSLRIRVVAPLGVRIARIVKRESVDRETARWMAEKTDQERAGFLFAVYGKRWDDPREYDMVFDTETEPVEQVVVRVKDALIERERSHTEASRKVLDMRARAARVKAGLIIDPAIQVPTLDVAADGEDLVLRGVVHHPKEHRRVEEAARKLAGDTPVRCELHYRGKHA